MKKYRAKIPLDLDGFDAKIKGMTQEERKPKRPVDDPKKPALPSEPQPKE